MASARDPYVLYSASNLGSMIALLGYPFVLEPSVGIHNQTILWAAAYAIFAVMIAVCVFLVRAIAPMQEPGLVANAADGPIQPLTARTRLQWILLSFVPSSLCWRPPTSRRHRGGAAAVGPAAPIYCSPVCCVVRPAGPVGGWPGRAVRSWLRCADSDQNLVVDSAALR